MNERYDRKRIEAKLGEPTRVRLDGEVAEGVFRVNPPRNFDGTSPRNVADKQGYCFVLNSGTRIPVLTYTTK